ncbi:MAG: DNA primase [Verrucomicrobia bacterium]|nr:DNA primase [Verrucomicrobiota bacterium]
MYTAESLEQLRQRIDLVEVLSPYVELKRAGASYKALCPFHEEKSPSFVVQKGDQHYHCYGCGAHGDAIEFLMSDQQMSFVDAVEHLAQIFQISLVKEEERASQGTNKGLLKEILRRACDLYHAALLKSPVALQYLENRGLDRSFIDRFEIGYGALDVDLKGIAAVPLLEEVGLVTKQGRPFFAERILFPICDAMGNVIGFSGRKIREETFGGKYINTPETPLFRKSKVLFGLHHCRRRIAKEKRAVIVEGQIDALRLIHGGINVVVAGQGTAFGEGQVRELLNLGVREVILAMDGDKAGREAAAKVGNLFQREGVAVKVVRFAEGADPDQMLKAEGIHALVDLFRRAEQYLSFLLEHYGTELDATTPAGKTQLVQRIAEQVREWENPVMRHATLRQLAELTELPEASLGVTHTPNLYRKVASHRSEVNPHLVLESDCLRWLLLLGDKDRWYADLAKQYLTPHHFQVPSCCAIYAKWLEGPCDLLTLAIALGDEEQKVMSKILERKVNRERGREQFPVAIQKLLERKWMEERESIHLKMQMGGHTDEELLQLAKEFDQLKAPQVSL